MSKPDTFAQLQNPRHEIVRLAERRKQLQVRSSDPPIVSNCSHSKSLHFSATYLCHEKYFFFTLDVCFPRCRPHLVLFLGVYSGKCIAFYHRWQCRIRTAYRFRRVPLLIVNKDLMAAIALSQSSRGKLHRHCCLVDHVSITRSV